MKVAFLIHPYNLSIVRSNLLTFYPFLKPCNFLITKLSDYFLKETYSRLPVHKFLSIKDIVCNDKIINFLGIMVPYFPEKFILNEAEAIEKIKNGINLAIKNGADIVGLGGFTSIVGNQGEEVSTVATVPITTGNTLTAALCIDGIKRACFMLGKNMESCNICIVGATGDIGSASARALANFFKKIILCSRRISSEDAIVKELKNKFLNKIEIIPRIEDAISDADVVLLATSAPGTIIDPFVLKSHSVVCDAALPHNISRSIRRERKDIFVFDGGRAKVPFYDFIRDSKWKSLFPFNGIFGCLAELFLLALENKRVNFSMGRGNITQSKIDEISALFNKHNFNLADFSCGNYVYTKTDIYYLRNH